MAKNKQESEQYKNFVKALKGGDLGPLYILYGEEHYLVERYLKMLKDRLVPQGFEEFNYRHFEGKYVTVSEIIQAVDSLPVFSERTFIEIIDFDIFSANESDRLLLQNLFSDMPEYACLVFVYDTIDYKPDRRLKDTKELLKNITEIECMIQDSVKISKWITKHVKECGKSISQADAEYLAFITGGSMTTLNTEIEKLSSYETSDTITRNSIDVCIIPVSDAVTYKLTNNIIKHDITQSFTILGDLLRMHEAPQKIVYGISSSMRQLLYAKICRDHKLPASYLMDNFGVKYPFQAQNLFQDASRFSLEKCRKYVLLCSEAAFKMNSGSDPESVLKDLVLSLCM